MRRPDTILIDAALIDAALMDSVLFDTVQPDTIPKSRADAKLEFGGFLIESRLTDLLTRVVRMPAVAVAVDFTVEFVVCAATTGSVAGPTPAEPSTPGTTTSPTRTLEPETVSKSSLSRPWNVVVWNDPITLMNYVVYVFQKLFGFSGDKATQLMLEVHQQGRTIVATVDREKAEYYVSRLHGFGLQASLEQTE
jgi:ATP-dependent Clp protease adaptor protein ClpS